MKVYIEKTNQTEEVNVANVKELLSLLKINPTTVIVTINDKLVEESKELNRKDNVKILSVISGG